MSGVCNCVGGPPPGMQCDACGAWGAPFPWSAPVASPRGWMCTKCGASLAPWQADCPCSPAVRAPAVSHYGKITGHPPYVGGDDDRVEQWQAVCSCGWVCARLRNDSTVAYMDLVAHLNGVTA